MSIEHHVVALGQGPPVVLIHGLLVGSVAQWYFTLAPALAPDHRVVCYDLRGHGRSARAPSGYDLGTLALDLASVVRDQGLSAPVDLVGHSYGGLIALTYALQHPGAVGRLVLVDVPLPPGGHDWLIEAVEGGVEGLLQALPGPVRQALSGGGRRARRTMARLGFLIGQSSLIADVLAQEPLSDEALARLPNPTLCLVGEASRCVPAMAHLAGLLPSARLQPVPGGHFVPTSEPDALQRHVVEFLSG